MPPSHHHSLRTATMTESVDLTEYDHDPSHSSDPPYREYVISSESSGVSVRRKDSESHRRTAARSSAARQAFAVPRQICRDLFLPVGYPQSVRPEYMSYQIYDSLQGLCSYLRGVVSTSALLTAAGVGNAEATAMGAAMVRFLSSSFHTKNIFTFTYLFL